MSEAIKSKSVDYSSDEYLKRVDEYWRAANYISVGQLYLLNNPLLQEPLKATDVKVQSATGARLRVKTLSMPT